MKFSPQFGGKTTGEKYERIRKSKNFEKGKFRNIEDTVTMTKLDLTSVFKYFTKQDTVPKFTIPIEKCDLNSYSSDNENSVTVTWFGHSAIILEVNNKKIFLDPMLSEVPAPHHMLGGKRFNSNLPMEIDDIPELDAVLISHDHYDHLDYLSIIKLKDKVKMFYVPLGIGAHLRLWQVDEAKIVELDWWEEVTLGKLTFICTPSRHFSGRGLFNRDSTLWCSWVIKGEGTNIFFSGDTGYNKTFSEIGDKFGPFDLTIFECGQYNEVWAEIHMMPEETVKVHSDLKGKLSMPIHWATFKLLLHSWQEPIERLIKEANLLNVNIITPKIGEVIVIGKSVEFTKWWRVSK